MPADLDDQLAAYGQWLERQCATSLHAPVPATLEPQPSIVDARRAVEVEMAAVPLHRRRRMLLGVAASCVVMAGVVGLVVTNRPTTAPPVPLNDSVGTVDPPGALFMLPVPLGDYHLSYANRSTAWPDPWAASETFDPNGFLVGVVDGTGFTALRTVSIYDTSPVDSGDWNPIDTRSGPAFTWTGPIVAVAQQRNDRWLVVTTPSEQQLAVDLLDVVTVDDQGGLDVNAQALGLDVIHRYSTEPAGVGYATYFEATASDGSAMTVETATESTPLFLVAGVADRIEPIEIDGAQAWIATRADPDGEWNGLIWSATPRRIVAVSGHTSITEVTRLAHRLEIVSEAAWGQAFPNATID